MTAEVLAVPHTPMREAKPSFVEAMEIVAAQVELLAIETVPVRRAAGRVTAQDVVARQSSPPFDMSAMDGFALHVADIAAGLRVFTLGADIAAGAVGRPESQPGVALPISTGARIPSGCGAVIAKERCDVATGRVRLFDPARPGANIRRMGEDVMAGQVVLPAGRTLTPAAIGTLASCGIGAIPVWSRPRVSLLIGGDELRGEMCDANGPMIVCLLENAGVTVIEGAPMADRASDVRDRIGASMDNSACDMIVSTGGVSVGAHDHVRAALLSLGAHIHFHGVAMRPGKPVLFATLPGGIPFFGLPGNPVAALAGFRFFVMTALRAMSGRPVESGIAVSPPCAGRPGTTMVLKARRAADTGEVTILPGQESHRLFPLVEADHWAIIAPSDSGLGATLYRL